MAIDWDLRMAGKVRVRAVRVVIAVVLMRNAICSTAATLLPGTAYYNSSNKTIVAVC